MRREAGMTQTQLADKLGITQRKLSYLEAGQTEPDMETLWRMADFFEVSTDFLLGRAEY